MNLSLIKTFPTSYLGTPSDLTFDGKFFYINHVGTKIGKYDQDFNLISNFLVPLYNEGITFDGKFFYVSDYTYKIIRKYDYNFNLIKTSSALGHDCRGLHFDGKFLYVCEYYNSTTGKYPAIAHKYDLDFKLIKNHTTIYAWCYGITSFRKGYFVTDLWGYRVFLYDFDFNLIDYSTGLGYKSAGIFYDGKFLYVCDVTNLKTKKYLVG